MGLVPRKRVLAERARLESTDSSGMTRSIGSQKVNGANLSISFFVFFVFFSFKCDFDWVSQR